MYTNSRVSILPVSLNGPKTSQAINGSLPLLAYAINNTISITEGHHLLGSNAINRMMTKLVINITSN